MSDLVAPRTRGDVAFHGLLLALCLLVLGLAGVLSVRGGEQVLLPGQRVAIPELCTSKRLWGIDCPGCGMTRSFIALAHGDVRRAWSYNPAGVWLFAIMLFQVPYRLLQLQRLYGGRQELTLGWVTHVALIILAVGLLGQWVLRYVGVAF